MDCAYSHSVVNLWQAYHHPCSLRRDSRDDVIDLEAFTNAYYRSSVSILILRSSESSTGNVVAFLDSNTDTHARSLLVQFIAYQLSQFPTSHD